MELDMQFKMAADVADFIHQLQKITADDIRIFCKDRSGAIYHIKDMQFEEDTVILVIN